MIFRRVRFAGCPDGKGRCTSDRVTSPGHAPPPPTIENAESQRWSYESPGPGDASAASNAAALGTVVGELASCFLWGPA